MAPQDPRAHGVLRLAEDLQTVHQLAQLTGGLVLAIKQQIRVNQRIHVQPKPITHCSSRQSLVGNCETITMSSGL
jgi:hypothetical protein